MSAPDWRLSLLDSYDRAAERYAETFFDELDRKPFDRDVLDRYAAAVRDRGRVCELGCGPGHIARHLAARGADVFGVDLSPRMVELARRLDPHIPFETGDLTALTLPDASLAGLVAFYSIIHVPRPHVPRALAGMARVLAPGGLLLLSFHGGDGEIHTTEFLGQPGEYHATLFQPAEMKSLVEAAGFQVDELLSRDPYDFEYPTPRVYVRARR